MMYTLTKSTFEVFLPVILLPDTYREDWEQVFVKTEYNHLNAADLISPYFYQKALQIE